MSSCPEEELARRFQERGDRRDFEQLCRLLLPGIQRHLLVLTRGDLTDADDLQQEVLVALYQSLPRFRFESSVRTWASRLTHHIAVGQMRSWIRRRRREDKHHRWETPLKSPEDPVAEVESAAQVAQVHRVLGQLDERDRSLIHLRELEGLSLEELAQVFQVPVGTIKSRLSRAKQALARRWEKEHLYG